MISATPQTAFATSHILYLHNAASDITCVSGGLNNGMDSTIGANPMTQRLDGTEDWWIEPDNLSDVTIPAGNWQVVFDTTTPSGPASTVTVKVLRVSDDDTTNPPCAVRQTIIDEPITMASKATQQYSTPVVNPGVVTVAAGERIIVTFAQTGGSKAVDLRFGGSLSWTRPRRKNTRNIWNRRSALLARPECWKWTMARTGARVHAAWLVR